MTKPRSKSKERDDRGQPWKRLTVEMSGSVAAAIGVLTLTGSVLDLIGIKTETGSVKFGIVILSLIVALVLGHYIRNRAKQNKS